MNAKLLLMVAAVLAISTNTGAQTTFDNALTLVNLTVSPNPVIAGANAVISFQLYNSYNYWVYQTTLQESGSYPLLNVSPATSYDIGQVNPGMNPRRYNYTIAIPNTTPSGTYTMHFNATYFVYGPTGVVVSTTSRAVSFYVQNRPQITVVASSSAPSALYSGYNQTVDFTIENNGYGTARNVSVVLRGGEGVNLLSSVTSFFIPNLTAGSSVSEPVLIAAENTANTSIMASTSYYSKNFNQHFTSTQKVNLTVVPAAQFSIASQSKNIGIGVTDSPVSFRITNTGTSEADQVQLSLETGYPITPVASTAYISDLKAGASTNVTFLVSVDSAGVPGNYPVTIYEQWKQPNGAVNQQFSGSNNYAIGVGSTGGIASATYIIAAVVVVLLVAVIMRTRKATAAKQKK
ncbi:MAG: hypothetical protein KGH64_04000 [Candidatus Micrarchaeota archaeon]|nr:hypothetical protein [Candidatus Micrarchaeota archaeon]